MPSSTNIPFRLLNQLRFGKTADGKIGAQVKPTGENPNNLAWITAVMKKGVDFSGPIKKEYFLNYEIEYLELREDYVEELHSSDWDLFCVRSETYYNIRDEQELERLLYKWISDMEELKPAANINHPFI